MKIEKLKKKINKAFLNEYYQKAYDALPRVREKFLRAKKETFLKSALTSFKFTAGLIIGAGVLTATTVSAPFAFPLLMVGLSTGMMGGVFVAKSNEVAYKTFLEKIKNVSMAGEIAVEQREKDIESGVLFTRYQKEIIPKNQDKLNKKFNKVNRISEMSVTEFKQALKTVPKIATPVQGK